MKTSVKAEVKRRRSKSELYIASVVQDWINHSTDDITRRRSVLACEINAIESEVFTLRARLADAQTRRERLEANLEALAMVVERRSVESC